MYVLPNGLCVGSTRHAKGGVSDIVTFKRNLSFHKKSVQKEEEDENITDEQNKSEKGGLY